jgi:hypothetical protein
MSAARSGGSGVIEVTADRGDFVSILWLVGLD